jgi:hypothetical protein
MTGCALHYDSPPSVLYNFMSTGLLPNIPLLRFIWTSIKVNKVPVALLVSWFYEGKLHELNLIGFRRRVNQATPPRDVPDSSGASSIRPQNGRWMGYPYSSADLFNFLITESRD